MKINKNLSSNANWIQRLIDLDKTLINGGVSRKDFAAKHKIDVKTVQRDLAVIKSMGCSIENRRDTDGIYRYRYSPKQEALFTQNKH